MASEHELIGPRWSVAEAAEKLGKHPSHLRRLWKRGVLPQPKKTAGGRPYFDDALLKTSMAVMRSGVGLNGEEVLFYRRRTKNRRCNRMERSTERQPAPAGDPYISKIKEAIAQFGIPEARLEPTAIQSLLTAIFGDERPEIATVLPELVKRLRP